MSSTAKSPYSQKQKGTKYSRRIERESSLHASEVTRRSRLLSGSKKTGAAINLPLRNCSPSKRCAETCYAMEGFVAAPHVIKATMRMDHILLTGEHLDKLAAECRKEPDVCLLGIGDFHMTHVPQVVQLAKACPDTVFWGFTRKRAITEALNHELPNLSIVLSWDATHHAHSHVGGYEGPLSYGPIQAGEEVPDDPRIIVVFPEHHQSHPDPKIKLHPKDCPATRIPTFQERLKYDACRRCGRCLKPHDVTNFDTSHFYGVVKP